MGRGTASELETDKLLGSAREGAYNADFVGV
jgi:hypothetical protein